MLEAIKKYNRSDKGKATRRRYFHSNPDVREWHLDYLKRRRVTARKKGICTRCLKNKIEKPYLQCTECREYMREFSKMKKLEEEIYG